MICLFATSFPPLVGYSSIVTMSGYVYGFVYGFIYAFTGAMAGSIVCFYFCRRWFKGQVRKLMAQNKTLKSVVRTVEKRGFRLLVLIRLAPYPFNVMNAILSATHIPLTTFITATAISLVKLTLHVYIGSTLSTLTEDDDEDETDPNKDRKAHGKRLKIAMMVMGVILGIGVGLYVWAVAKREIAITEAARLERHRQRRRANGGNRSQSSYDHDRIGGAGGNGIELNEQQGYIPDVDLTSRDSIDGFFSGAGNERSGGRGQDLSDARYFVGGAGSRDHYQEDYEDDGDHEGNSLFGTNRVWHQQQQQQQEQSWRNVGAGDNNIEYSDSDPSDYSDDSDFERDDDDLERGLELSLGRDRDGVEEEEEEEALDFSAHHDEFVESPWHDEENNDKALLNKI
ncbi:Tlg2-vesicle protein [Linnemannia zychae]|nr:Tlg2-vesicle protein [Linnemannia zychae]